MILGAQSLSGDPMSKLTKKQKAASLRAVRGAQ